MLILIEHREYIIVTGHKEIRQDEFIPSFAFFKNILVNAVSAIKNAARFRR